MWDWEHILDILQDMLDMADIPGDPARAWQNPGEYIREGFLPRR